MKPIITLKKINSDIIVTENGKPKVFATVTEALKRIFEVRNDEPR